MWLDEQTILALGEKLSQFSLLLAFIAPFIGGEMAVLLLAFLAGQGILPLWSVVIGSFLGMITLDSFWFMVPRTRLAERFKRWNRVSDRYKQLEKKVEHFSHRSDILILLISKVLLGTRILILTYLSVRNISFKKFTLFNSVATALWAAALGLIGWFAGLGYYSVSQASGELTVGAFYVVGAVGLFYGALWLFRRWFARS